MRLPQHQMFKSFDQRLESPIITNPYSFGGDVAGWKEIARTTLGSDTSTIDVSSLDDKRYYMILSHFNLSGNGNPYIRLNADTGGNFANRYTLNGASDSTLTSNSNGRYGWVSGVNALPYFHVDFAGNVSSKEKLLVGNTSQQNTAGATNVPNRGKGVWKHVQTSNPITSVNHHDQTGSYNFVSGSECVVLGWDPDDIHTTNFWEELTTKELGSNGDLITDTFTAKQYLWVQCYFAGLTSANDTSMQFNGDTTTYAARYSYNGAADSTITSDDGIRVNATLNITTPQFYNIFIVNDSSSEKMAICEGIFQNTAGAGTAPNRQTTIGKYDNTSGQITQIELNNSAFSGTVLAGSILKVWGSD